MDRPDAVETRLGDWPDQVWLVEKAPWGESYNGLGAVRSWERLGGAPLKLIWNDREGEESTRVCPK